MSEMTKMIQGPIRLGLFAFALAICGAMLAFAAASSVIPNWGGQLGFGIVVIAVLAGFGAVVWGQSRFGKSAIFGSREAALDLKDQIKASLQK